MADVEPAAILRITTVRWAIGGRGVEAADVAARQAILAARGDGASERAGEALRHHLDDTNRGIHLSEQRAECLPLQGAGT